jgi:hypothetical protein
MDCRVRYSPVTRSDDTTIGAMVVGAVTGWSNGRVDVSAGVCVVAEEIAVGSNPWDALVRRPK